MNIIELSQIVYDYGILVFLLIFTVIFAVLQKSKIFGEAKKNFNVIVALVISLIVIIPHFAGVYNRIGYDPVDIVNASLPSISVVMIAAIMLLLLVGLFGAEARWFGTSISGWIAIISVFIVAYVFGGAAGWWVSPSQMFSWWDSETTSMILILLVFGIIIWYITKEPGEGHVLHNFGDAFKGIGRYFGGKD